ncbi:MAG: hypothetical protein CMJ58_03575 [Planctomycetaceae bacterium]|nr:hypothetical protein [Planctomycetaceae bacterium]
MCSVRFRGLALGAAIATALTTPALGQITEFPYSGGAGTQTWQNAANWGGAGFPDGSDHLADLSQPLGGDATVNLNTGSTITLAGLRIGGSAGAVTTTIGGTNATIVFQNDYTEDLASADFSNNAVVDGQDFLIWQRGFGITNPPPTNATGDANADVKVDATDLMIWSDNYGANATGLAGGIPQIITGNVGGSINQITTNVRLANEDLQMIGGSDLTVTGAISWEGNPAAVDENEIGASVSVLTNGRTMTIDGNINLTNLETTTMFGRLGLNTANGSYGTIVVNGQITETTASNVQIGVPANGQESLGSVILNNNNTYSGSTWFSRTNVVVNHPNGLGTSTLRHVGPANQFGYNLIAGDDSLTGGKLVLNNDMIIGQWQSIRGDNSIELAGHVTQTNNRGFANLLTDGAELILSGRLDIWEDDEALEREFEFDGGGNTRLTGVIRGTPDEFSEPAGNLRIIKKSGTGAMVIDVANLGDNSHAGDTRVVMGNLHYANEKSLNQGVGEIIAYGGAVGIDTGVTSAEGATFLGKINPDSTGGLQLAASDAAASLDFTGALANAANMTVAAPETGLTFTGSITPANSTYGLGGGSGKLTLPNAQLSGANSVEVRNGGEVELLGDNTYTGATRVLAKYLSTQQARAEANNAGNIDGVFYEEVAPVLVVDDLANGGAASSIGAASSDAANLYLQGSTLRYIGAGDSTNRLFTIGTGGGTLDSSGAGAVMFTNAGAVAMRDVSTTITGDLNDWEEDPSALYNVSDTSDIIIGMTVSDPQTGGFVDDGCGPGGSNCIPAGTTVTGVSDNGNEVGISDPYSFVYKTGTQLVFGPVERTLTLTGSNAGDNTIASAIGDSAAGSVVAIHKTGSGKWILSGANTYTGDTIIDEGVLSITSAFLDDDSTVEILSGAALDLSFAGTDIVEHLVLAGTSVADGIWGAPGSGAANTTSLLSGTGWLNVGGVGGALAAVPEPAAGMLMAVAAVLCGAACRRRRG